MKVAISFSVGLVLWTLLEYGLHRFAGHARCFAWLLDAGRIADRYADT